MRYLRANTATIVTVGPFYDATNGVTIETALTITNERITFIVDNNDGSAPTLVLDNVTGATSATDNDLNYITNNDAGLMQLELTAANTNHAGKRAMLSITDATNHVPVFHEFMILVANVYDALIGTDYLQVDAVQQGGTTLTARDIGASVLLSSGTGTGQISLSSGTVTTGALSNNAITANAIASDAIAAAKIASGAITNAKFAAGAIDATAIASDAIAAAKIATGAITAAKFAAGAIDAAAIANGAIDAATFAADVDAEILSYLVDDATRIDASALNTLSGHDPGETIMGATDLGTGSGFTAIPWNASWDAEVQSECNDALVALHLDHLLAEDYDPASKPGTATALLNELVENDGGVSRFTVNSLENAPSGSGASAETIADAVWDEALSGHTGAGTAGKALADAQSAGDPWATALPGSYGDGTAGKIIGDNVNAPIGTVDTVVDAIKAKTDSLTFTVAGDVDVNVQTWKGSAAADMTGDAFARLGAPAGASVSADIAAIEAQTDDIGVAGAGLTAVPWNAAWDAEVQSECTDALNAYDPPTNAEMEARTLVSANYATAANQATMDGKLDTIDNFLDTEIAAILEDTGTTLNTHLTDIKGATFNGATDSLEALRDRGDAAWVTATGFSTLTAQQVWEYATRVLTAGTNLSIPSAADIKTAMEAAGGHLALILEDTGTTLNGKIDTIDGIVDAILVDTGTTLDTALEVIKRAVVYKKILTFDGDDEGNLELFASNGSSLGTIVDAFTEDATTKTQKALIAP